MSDFLGRLVQRSLTASPPRAGQTAEEAGLARLTPRLPSLFESPGGDVTAPEAASAAPEEARPPDDSRRETEGPGPSRTLASTAQALVRPATSAQAGTPAATPVGPPSFGERMAQDKDRAAQSARPAAIQPQIIHHEPAEADRPSGENRAEPRPLGRLMPVPPSSPITVSRGDGRQAEAGSAATHLGEPTGTTVRINIGRIEVSAIHPPQPPASTRKIAPAPRLTLEDYAKQRNEGKR
jgi:hypothetical protein